MKRRRPVLFNWGHFEPEIIVCAGHWYCVIACLTGVSRSLGQNAALMLTTLRFGGGSSATRQNWSFGGDLTSNPGIDPGV